MRKCSLFVLALCLLLSGCSLAALTVSYGDGVLTVDNTTPFDLDTAEAFILPGAPTTDEGILELTNVLMHSGTMEDVRSKIGISCLRYNAEKETAYSIHAVENQAGEKACLLVAYCLECGEADDTSTKDWTVVSSFCGRQFDDKETIESLPLETISLADFQAENDVWMIRKAEYWRPWSKFYLTYHYFEDDSFSILAWDDRVGDGVPILFERFLESDISADSEMEDTRPDVFNIIWSEVLLDVDDFLFEE